MRTFIMTLVIMAAMSFSVCGAQDIPDVSDVSVEKAYSLYYKGQKETAIEMMEEYVKDNPEPEAFYFLGYAYYEMKVMDKAAKYFNEAFVRSPFYSPMPEEK